MHRQIQRIAAPVVIVLGLLLGSLLSFPLAVVAGETMDGSRRDLDASIRRIERAVGKETDESRLMQEGLDLLADGVQDTIDQLTDSVRKELEEASRRKAKEQELARRKMLASFSRNAEAYLTLSDRITAETPWLIRVNQTTCVVTIYRMLEISPGETVSKHALANLVRRNIISGEGEWVENVRNASAEEDRASENDASGDGMSWSAILDSVLPETVTVWFPVYACPCSTGAPGRETPTGTFYIQDHLRWHELIGPTWGQWCCHFAPSYLFHSLPYERPNDPNSLQGDFYNQIGQAVSHGCVRLTCVDAKYIYDNVPTGGKVEVFYGTEEDDLFGKPTRPYVGEWTKQYDPTDPEYRPE